MRISWLIPLVALTLAACQAREPQAPGRPADQAAAPPAATAPVPPPTLEPAPRTAAAPGCCACPPARTEAACPPAKAKVHRAHAPRRVRAPSPPPQRVARLERDEGGYERYERYSERTGAEGGVRLFEDRSYEETSRSSERYFDDGADCCAASAEAAGRDANGFLNWPGKVPAIP